MTAPCQARADGTAAVLGVAVQLCCDGRRDHEHEPVIHTATLVLGERAILEAEWVEPAEEVQP